MFEDRWQMAAGFRKVGRIALRVFGGLVGVVALVAGIGVLVLRSNWGGERLRRQIVVQVNQQLRGHLAIDRLSFGGDKLVLWGVALQDPDGLTVAHVDRAEVAFSVPRLLRKEVRLTAVVVERPVLRIVSDESGSNLARAVEPRTRKPPKPTQPERRGAAEGWVIRLDRFDLTNGDVSLAARGDDEEDLETLHVADIGVFVSARYATGNAALDLSVRIVANSRRDPEGPLGLSARVVAHGGTVRADASGTLLSGTLEVHGQVDRGAPERANGTIALAIPRQTLAGYDWGPFRVDGEIHPGTRAKLDARLAIPGVDFVAKDHADPVEGVGARLTVTNLGLTGRALRSLTGANIQPLAGDGEVKVALEKGSDSAWGARVDGRFETLRFGTTALAQMTFGGRTARLSGRPGSGSFDLAVASLSSSSTQLRGLGLSVKLQDQDLSASLRLATPARVALALVGRFADDWRGFTLASLTLTFPGSRWTSAAPATLRFDDDELSLSSFRLSSEGQTLSIEGSRRGDKVAGRLALADLRLGRLPTVLLDPALRVDGQVDVDVTADGTTDAPQVVARADLKQGRYQGLTKIDLQLGATLRDQDVYATLDVRTPFADADARLKTTTTPLAPNEPFELALDVKRLEVGRLLRGLEKPETMDGRVKAAAHVDGTAAAPRVVLTVEASDLSMRTPATPGTAAASAEVGHGRLHATYGERAARADLDFKSAHGGTLAVDAAVHVNLGYPRGARRLVIAKVPLTGKVTAKNLEVGWIAAFNPRVESLGGQVTADARLAGTVAEPQIVGDIRWKNGTVVANAKKPVAAKRAPSATTAPPARSAR